MAIRSSAVPSPMPVGPPSPPGAPVIAAAVLVRGPVAVAVAAIPVMAVAGAAQQVGLWVPGVAVPSLAVGAVLAWLTVRRLPVPRIPLWAVLAVLAIAVAAGVWAGLTHGEHVAVRRDAGAYATYALSLARFGGVPIDPGLDAFGLAADDPFVRVSGGANYQVPVVEGGRVTDLLIVPQFFVGAPAMLTLGWWAAGWTGLFLVPAVQGGVALAAFGALGAVVAGARVAVASTATLALALPVLLANRQTYSEPPSLMFLAAAFTVSALAVAARTPGSAFRLGVLAGALVGANLFVRIDAFREIVLLIPVVTVLVLLRHRAGAGIAVGTLLTAVPAVLAATPWDSPYVNQVGPSVVALLAAGTGLTAVGAAVVAAGRRVPPERFGRVLRVLPGVAAGTLALTGLVLLSRPLWLVTREDFGLPGYREFVTNLQVAQGLPVDPFRSYAEYTLVWMSWWLGPVALALAFVAAVALVHRGAREVVAGSMPPWLPVLAVGVAGAVLTLIRPAITPDHPWADRRLVTTALPTVALLAAVALVWVVDRVAARAPAGRARSAVAAVTSLLALVALVVPPAVSTWPLATARTELGQPAAADAVCDALPPDAAVIAVDDPTRVIWGPVLRARCGVPLVGIVARPEIGDDTARIAEAGEAARANGHVPYLLAGATPSRRDGTAQSLGVQWSQVADLRTTEPQRLLVERPDGTRPLTLELWLAPL